MRFPRSPLRGGGRSSAAVAAPPPRRHSRGSPRNLPPPLAVDTVELAMPEMAVTQMEKSPRTPGSLGSAVTRNSERIALEVQLLDEHIYERDQPPVDHDTAPTSEMKRQSSKPTKEDRLAGQLDNEIELLLNIKKKPSTVPPATVDSKKAPSRPTSNGKARNASPSRKSASPSKTRWGGGGGGGGRGKNASPRRGQQPKGLHVVDPASKSTRIPGAAPPVKSRIGELPHKPVWKAVDDDSIRHLVEAEITDKDLVGKHSTGEKNVSSGKDIKPSLFASVFKRMNQKGRAASPRKSRVAAADPKKPHEPEEEDDEDVKEERLEAEFRALLQASRDSQLSHQPSTESHVPVPALPSHNETEDPVLQQAPLAVVPILTEPSMRSGPPSPDTRTFQTDTSQTGTFQSLQRDMTHEPPITPSANSTTTSTSQQHPRVYSTPRLSPSSRARKSSMSPIAENLEFELDMWGAVVSGRMSCGVRQQSSMTEDKTLEEVMAQATKSTPRLLEGPAATSRTDNSTQKALVDEKSTDDDKSGKEDTMALADSTALKSGASLASKNSKKSTTSSKTSPEDSTHGRVSAADTPTSAMCIEQSESQYTSTVKPSVQHIEKAATDESRETEPNIVNGDSLSALTLEDSYIHVNDKKGETLAEAPSPKSVTSGSDKKKSKNPFKLFISKKILRPAVPLPRSRPTIWGRLFASPPRSAKSASKRALPPSPTASVKSLAKSSKSASTEKVSAKFGSQDQHSKSHPSATLTAIQASSSSSGEMPLITTSELKATSSHASTLDKKVSVQAADVSDSVHLVVKSATRPKVNDDGKECDSQPLEIFEAESKPLQEMDNSEQDQHDNDQPFFSAGNVNPSKWFMTVQGLRSDSGDDTKHGDTTSMSTGESALSPGTSRDEDDDTNGSSMLSGQVTDDDAQIEGEQATSVSIDDAMKESFSQQPSDPETSIHETASTKSASSTKSARSTAVNEATLTEISNAAPTHTQDAMQSDNNNVAKTTVSDIATDIIIESHSDQDKSGNVAKSDTNHDADTVESVPASQSLPRASSFTKSRSEPSASASQSKGCIEKTPVFQDDSHAATEAAKKVASIASSHSEHSKASETSMDSTVAELVSKAPSFSAALVEQEPTSEANSTQTSETGVVSPDETEKHLELSTSASSVSTRSRLFNFRRIRSMPTTPSTYAGTSIQGTSSAISEMQSPVATLQQKGTEETSAKKLDGEAVDPADGTSRRTAPARLLPPIPGTRRKFLLRRGRSLLPTQATDDGVSSLAKSQLLARVRSMPANNKAFDPISTTPVAAPADKIPVLEAEEEAAVVASNSNVSEQATMMDVHINASTVEAVVVAPAVDTSASDIKPLDSQAEQQAAVVTKKASNLSRKSSRVSTTASRDATTDEVQVQMTSSEVPVSSSRLAASNTEEANTTDIKTSESNEGRSNIVTHKSSASENDGAPVKSVPSTASAGSAELATVASSNSKASAAHAAELTTVESSKSKASAAPSHKSTDSKKMTDGTSETNTTITGSSSKGSAASQITKGAVAAIVAAASQSIKDDQAEVTTDTPTVVAAFRSSAASSQSSHSKEDEARDDDGAGGEEPEYDIVLTETETSSAVIPIRTIDTTPTAKTPKKQGGFFGKQLYDPQFDLSFIDFCCEYPSKLFTEEKKNVMVKGKSSSRSVRSNKSSKSKRK